MQLACTDRDCFGYLWLPFWWPCFGFLTSCKWHRPFRTKLTSKAVSQTSQEQSLRVHMTCNRQPLPLLVRGTYVWGETYCGARTVTPGRLPTDSSMSLSVCIVGTSATLQAAVTANSTLYLEVMARQILSQSGNLRSQFGSSAYAVNSDFLDGLDSSAFGQLSSSNSWVAAQSSMLFLLAPSR